MLNISAVVVTYNRLNLLKKCLKALVNQNPKIANIFVVNNNSTDGTKNYLNNLRNNQIKVINLNKNLGGAGGFNHGLRYAVENSSSKYFWLMDDDCMPTCHAAINLIDADERLHGNFGFLSSNVRWWKNNQAVNVPIVTNDWSSNISKSLVKIKESTFVSFFVPRVVVNKLGLPLTSAFIWGDDTEYTSRISEKYPCYFVPQSIVYHNSQKIDSNENIFNEDPNRISFYKFGFRNNLYIDKRYRSYKRFIKDALILLIYIFEIPFKSHSHRLIRMYYTWIGLFNGLFFHPKIQFPKK